MGIYQQPLDHFVHCHTLSITNRASLSITLFASICKTFEQLSGNIALCPSITTFLPFEGIRVIMRPKMTIICYLYSTLITKEIEHTTMFF